MKLTRGLPALAGAAALVAAAPAAAHYEQVGVSCTAVTFDYSVYPPSGGTMTWRATVAGEVVAEQTAPYRFAGGSGRLVFPLALQGTGTVRVEYRFVSDRVDRGSAEMAFTCLPAPPPADPVPPVAPEPPPAAQVPPVLPPVTPPAGPTPPAVCPSSGLRVAVRAPRRVIAGQIAFIRLAVSTRRTDNVRVVYGLPRGMVLAGRPAGARLVAGRVVVRYPRLRGARTVTLRVRVLRSTGVRRHLVRADGECNLAVGRAATVVLPIGGPRTPAVTG